LNTFKDLLNAFQIEAVVHRIRATKWLVKGGARVSGTHKVGERLMKGFVFYQRAGPHGIGWSYLCLICRPR